MLRKVTGFEFCPKTEIDNNAIKSEDGSFHTRNPPEKLTQNYTTVRPAINAPNDTDAPFRIVTARYTCSSRTSSRQLMRQSHLPE